MSTTAAPTTSRWWFPSLVGYQRSWLVKDLVAGLAAGAVVVPQAMAYATIANMPVEIGLYTCIVPMFVYAFLGGSRAMSVSTTSTIATLTATTLVAAGIAAGSKDALGALMTLSLLTGVILILARICKLGALVENISSATVLGLKIGVGATVAVAQLPKLLGETTNTSGEGFIRSVFAVAEALPSLDWTTVALSAGSILTLVLLKRFAPRVPGALVIVLGGILLVAFTTIEQHGVELIAPVPSGLPVPGLPDFTHIEALVPGALAIAVMAFLESAAVARSLRKMEEPPVDANQELFATGVANVAGAFFTTLPAAGGFSQSAVNEDAGAKTQLSTMVTVVLAIAVAVFLGPVLSLLPQATLAAMVFVAVIGLINIPELVSWWTISRFDFWIATSVALVGLTAGLLPAVAIGVVVTLVVVLRELNIPRVYAGERRGGAVAMRMGEGLYTANAKANMDEVLRLVSARQNPVTAVVMDAERLRRLSITVLEALEGLDRELAGRGIVLHVAALPPRALEVAQRVEWYRGLEEAGRAHATVEEALVVAAAPAV